MASPSPAVVKRLNFILSEKAHSDLVALSRETRRSMTDLIRFGVGLVRIALEAEKRGNKLVVVNQDDRAVIEIVLPG